MIYTGFSWYNNNNIIIRSYNVECRQIKFTNAVLKIYEINCIEYNYINIFYIT